MRTEQEIKAAIEDLRKRANEFMTMYGKYGEEPTRCVMERVLALEWVLEKRKVI